MYRWVRQILNRHTFETALEALSQPPLCLRCALQFFSSSLIPQASEMCLCKGHTQIPSVCLFHYSIPKIVALFFSLSSKYPVSWISPVQCRCDLNRFTLRTYCGCRWGDDNVTVESVPCCCQFDIISECCSFAGSLCFWFIFLGAAHKHVCQWGFLQEQLHDDSAAETWVQPYILIENRPVLFFPLYCVWE